MPLAAISTAMAAKINPITRETILRPSSPKCSATLGVNFNNTQKNKDIIKHTINTFAKIQIKATDAG